jgi:uncharacterized protein YciI
MMDHVYVQLVDKRKPFTADVIERHIAYLRGLDKDGRLVLCGPFTDFPGGMVVIRASSREEADRIVQSDPFIAEGYETYNLRTLEVADASTDFGA